MWRRRARDANSFVVFVDSASASELSEISLGVEVETLSTKQVAHSNLCVCTKFRVVVGRRQILDLTVRDRCQKIFDVL